ncbi:complexin-3-like [Pelodiscus sinensis]|uniref:complexin-3-like n=1 Tax=Pelodiscus sinensis TaxID=13735 RepID=UPI000D722BAB|nr:complexin-3-like [Pelodiscus sinensis]|eukprot:XP_025042683.1 complexin-3-like [Pelodiscus sinensis]
MTSENIAWMFFFSKDGLLRNLRSASASDTLLPSPLQLAPMASVVKSALRAPVKQLQCCISADIHEDKDRQALGGCIKGPAEQNQRTQDKTSKRDMVYAQRKAERAAIRTHIREKYQLPKNEMDKKQLEAIGGEVKMLQAAVRPQGSPESDSCLSGLSATNLGSLKKTSLSMMRSLRPEMQCPVM